MAIARTPKISGAFHGAMPKTTPTGCRIDNARSPGLSDGITSPVIWVVIAAASRAIPEASATLNAAQVAVAPVSSIIAEVNSSALDWMASAALFKSVRRAPGPNSAHSGNAAAAASAANISSSTEAAAALVAHSPDTGLRRSKVFPPLAGTSLAPINNCVFIPTPSLSHQKYNDVTMLLIFDSTVACSLMPYLKKDDPRRRRQPAI